MVRGTRFADDVRHRRLRSLTMHTKGSTRVLAAALCTLLAGAALGSAARVAHAETVYKCRAADGGIAFQDHACAGGAAESRVEIAPPPPLTPSPEYGRDTRETHRSAHAATTPRTGARQSREAVSYECRAANGELFYRHGACPAHIAARGADAGKHGRSGASQTVAVSSEALPRGEVCRRIAAAGSIGRAGHERDQNVSTYDRNLGRDPCRYF
jgi:uncharacterized protein DUF4124